MSAYGSENREEGMVAENELGKGSIGVCGEKRRESSVIDDDHLLFTLNIQKDEVFSNRKESYLGWETFISGDAGVVLKMQIGPG